MNSRVEKYGYEEETIEIPSRVERNQDLYSNLNMQDFSQMKPNDNVKVIETSSNKIDLDKIKKYIDMNMNEEVQTRSVVVKKEIEDSPKSEIFEEEKDYDINSILDKAKENKETYYEDEKHRKLRDTQYDILSKIKIYEEDEEEKEEENVELNTDEKTLIDLINTVTKNKSDLLEELKKGSENTIVTAPIEEEENNDIMNDAIKVAEEEMTSNEEQSDDDGTEAPIKNLDKSFYTNSMNFSKEDFEGFEELEKTVKKNNSFVKISIIALVLLALGTIFVVLKYVLNLF